MRNVLKSLSFVTLAWNLLTILVGAAVRATGSGAGCGSHWPLCNGEVLPSIQASKTFIEFSHRLTSGVALLLVLILFILTLKQCPRPHLARRYASLALLFILTEAALGAGLVLFELVAENDSVARAIVIVLHLMNTLLLLVGLVGHYLSLNPLHRVASSPRAKYLMLLITVLSVFFLIGSSGAITALGDTLFPSTSLLEGMREDLSTSAHFLIRLRAIHPFVAVAFGIGVLMLPLWAPLTKQVQRVLIAFVLMQWGVGAINLVLLAPVSLQLLHLLVADLFWLYLVALTLDDRFWRKV